MLTDMQHWRSLHAGLRCLSRVYGCVLHALSLKPLFLRHLVSQVLVLPVQALRKQPTERPSAVAMLEHAWVRRRASAAAASSSISDVGRPRAVLASTTNIAAQHAAAIVGARATITIKPSAAAKVRFCIICPGVVSCGCSYLALIDACMLLLIRTSAAQAAHCKASVQHEAAPPVQRTQASSTAGIFLGKAKQQVLPVHSTVNSDRVYNDANLTLRICYVLDARHVPSQVPQQNSRQPWTAISAQRQPAAQTRSRFEQLIAKVKVSPAVDDTAACNSRTLVQELVPGIALVQ